MRNIARSILIAFGTIILTVTTIGITTAQPPEGNDGPASMLVDQDPCVALNNGKLVHFGEDDEFWSQDQWFVTNIAVAHLDHPTLTVENLATDEFMRTTDAFLIYPPGYDSLLEDVSGFVWNFQGCDSTDEIRESFLNRHMQALRFENSGIVPQAIDVENMSEDLSSTIFENDDNDKALSEPAVNS